MAKQPDITVVSSGFYSTATINANFEAVQEAFDNVISRDGSSPNTMSADLDMNSNGILNASSVHSSRFYRNGVELVPSGLISVEYENYTEGSTGTVAREVPDRLRDLVTVKDFGADPSNSSSENTADFQAAIDSGKSPIFVPQGNYSLNVSSLTGVDRATGGVFLGLGSTYNSSDKFHGLRGWHFGPDGVYVENYDIWMNDNRDSGVDDQQTGASILLTCKSDDTVGVKAGLAITAQQEGTVHGNAARFNSINSSTFAGANTTLYTETRTHGAAVATFGIHNEQKKGDGGTSISFSSENAIFVDSGLHIGFKMQQSSSGNAASTAHPDTGEWPKELDSAWAFYVLGTETDETWNSGTTYEVGQWVVHSGTFYSCILGHTNQTPPNATYWQSEGTEDLRGKWKYGLYFKNNAIRSTGETIRIESLANYHFHTTPGAASTGADIFLQADSPYGLVMTGTYSSGSAIRVPTGMAVSFDSTGTIKQLYSSGQMRWLNGANERVSIEIDPTPRILLNETQVVGERQTGWSVMTGTAVKGGSFDTSTVTLGQLATVVKALQDAAVVHGLIGA